MDRSKDSDPQFGRVGRNYAMSTSVVREIAREDWVSFFNTFSLRHARWLVTVEIHSSELGDRVEASSVRFEGLNADLKDGENAIAIDVANAFGASLTHAIAKPTSVRVACTEHDGCLAEYVEITSASGITTRLRFLAGPDLG
jgi:uncharacterized protein DUF5335